MSYASDLSLRLAKSQVAFAKTTGVGTSSANATLARAQARADAKIRSSRQATRSVVPAADLASNMLVGKDSLQPQGGGFGAVVQQITASGGVFTEFTYCASGSPVTGWWPVWPANPS